jgi:glycosyltransferase involved in cell wall biosynthesis
MKICVDIQAAVAQRAGVGRYTRLLAENLAKIAGNENLSFFYFDFMRRSLPFSLPNSRGLRWCPGRAAQLCWKYLAWPAFDLLAGTFDVYHFTNFIIPPLASGKKVVTIYDASFLRYPEFAEKRNLAYLRSKIGDTIARADAIITISQFSAEELSSFFPAARGKIHVIYPGVAEHMGPQQVHRSRFTVQRLGNDNKGDERPYILTVGTLEPRKNFEFLIQVFEKMDNFKGDLVIIGRLGWKYSAILERIRSSPRADEIHVLTDVDDEELPAIYAGARVFVFPSLYEGFGFPPLEAAACGVPVISSPAGSLREVLGSAALFVENFNVSQWAEAIFSLLNDQAKRQALIERGKKQSALYTWQATAAKTLELYRSLIQ